MRSGGRGSKGIKQTELTSQHGKSEVITTPDLQSEATRITKLGRQAALTELREIGCKALRIRSEKLAESLVMEVLSFLKPEENVQGFLTALDALEDLEPANAAEAMLAVQAIGVHKVATDFLARAANPENGFEAVNANVSRATKLMNLFVQQMDMMLKLKGKASQKIVIERVDVRDGGQAVVGSVATVRGEG